MATAGAGGTSRSNVWAAGVHVACALLAGLALSLAAPAQAQAPRAAATPAPAAAVPDAGAGVAIYRCTDAGGQVSVQNMPCPKGQKQERKMMQSVAAPPMYAPLVSSPESRNAAAAAAGNPPASTAAEGAPMPLSPYAAHPIPKGRDIADADRLPPPRLYECGTYDGDRYTTEETEPRSRCVALGTVGLDGNPATGAGEACEVKVDTCGQVPDARLCAAWTKSLREAESRWRFSGPANRDARKAEFDRAAAIMRESTCGRSGPNP